MARKLVRMLTALGVLLPGVAAAQSQIPARVMVLIDTSGSMGLYFKDPTGLQKPPNGDYPGGDGSTLYSDANLTDAQMYPGKLVAGVREGTKSRLFAAKNAFNQAINAYGGDVDFGLMSYDFQLCGFNTPLCNPCDIKCQGFTCSFNCLYADAAFTKLISTNWAGRACQVGSPGGKIIELPATGSNVRILPWIDGVEVHKSGPGGLPQNPEIRGDGPTPLAESIAVAKTQWYDVVKASDPQLNCRPYGLVVLTDGVQSVGGTCGADPVAAVTTVRNANPTNPVSVYVIAVSIASAQDKKTMNDMAKAGGTTAARFADKPEDIEAAFADITSSTVKFEQCNGSDDTCNGLIDEGMGVFQECTANNQCASGVCNSGRCTCGSSSQCAAGNTCSSGFCVPGCQLGVGACQKSGVMKCSGAGAACCVDNGSATCTPLAAGTPTTEVCNGVDDDCDGLIDEGGVCQQCIPVPETCNGKDDDCDGIKDNNLTDINKPCGVAIGICTQGTTSCVNGVLTCSGGAQPKAETCNGVDDNCDGIVDGITQACFTGPAAARNKGICVDGQQSCPPGAGQFGACVGEVLPKAETCNGLDDDCDGTVDNVAGAGQACCPYKDGQGNSLCGKGVCTTGVNACSGGSLQCVGGTGPTPETCNGIDDDCNGVVDDVGGIGGDCCPSGKCGTGACTAGKQACQGSDLVCVGYVGPAAETCDGVDNDCDGIVDNVPGNGAQCCPQGANCGVGLCKFGTQKCVGNALVCEGSVSPADEVCDGLDNDCNGIVDDVAAAGTSCCPGGSCGTGICKAGAQKCQGNALVCVGSISPGDETCNGLDDDCNGVVDDAPGVNDDCCPYKNSDGTSKCGTGVCAFGKLTCVTGTLFPQCVGATGPAFEICDGLDNDCNGVVDDLPGGQIGEVCCTSGLCGKGVCKEGKLGCTEKGLECVGEVRPSQEECNGLDDDCNGDVDDIPGLGQACCPSGLCGKGICKGGILTCTGQGLECQGAVEPEKETCNGLDDDCNGVIDDVEGSGEPCCPEGSPAGEAPGACNKGVCKPGTFKCEGNALVCVGGKAPDAEVCDGTDNDCDGQIDEADDVAKNDPAIGKACDEPKAGADSEPCAAGKTVCKAGKPQCEGAVAPEKETCDGVDNDCDGMVDDGDLCDNPKKCIKGSCVSPCENAEFPCPGGYVCENGFCIPPATGSGGAGGKTGAGGSGQGKGGSAAGGKPGTGAGGATASGGSGQGKGGTGQATGGAAAGGEATGQSGSTGTAPTSGAGAAAPDAASEDTGGCGCEAPGRAKEGSAALLSMAVAALVARRRRSVKEAGR